MIAQLHDAGRRPRLIAKAGVALLLLPMFATQAQVSQAPPERKVEPPVKYTHPMPGVQMSILAQANLNAPRAKAPMNFTGTWLMQRTATNGPPPDWEFWPLPKLTPAGQEIYNAKLKADAEGKAYHDDTARCYPPGMPRYLTRVWPIEIIQLPTAIIMIQGFENNVRWIYMDGRKHVDPDTAVSSYDGDSIGHWEGKSLIVDTINLEPSHHWVQAGIPMSADFHIVEKWTLSDDGKVLDIQLTMTDPKYWVGDWVNTKHYNLRDDRDIGEIECIAEQMAKLPSAQGDSNVR